MRLPRKVPPSTQTGPQATASLVQFGAWHEVSRQATSGQMVPQLLLDHRVVKVTDLLTQSWRANLSLGAVQ